MKATVLFLAAMAAVASAAWNEPQSIPELAQRAMGAVGGGGVGVSDDELTLLRAVHVLDEARAYLISQASGAGGGLTASAAARAAAMEAAEAARLAGKGVAGAATGAVGGAVHRVKDALHIGGVAMPTASDLAGKAAAGVGLPRSGGRGGAGFFAPEEEPGALRRAAIALHLAEPPATGVAATAKKAMDAAGRAVSGSGGGGGCGGGGLTGLMMGQGRGSGGGQRGAHPPSVLEKVKDALHFGARAAGDAAAAASEGASGAAGSATDAASAAATALGRALSSFAADAAATASDAASLVQGASSDTASAAAKALVDARSALDARWADASAAYEKTSGSARTSLAKQWADAQRARAAAGAKVDEAAHHLAMAVKKGAWEAPKAAVAEL